MLAWNIYKIISECVQLEQSKQGSTTCNMTGTLNKQSSEHIVCSLLVIQLHN